MPRTAGLPPGAQLPVLDRWVRNLLLGLFGLYVAELLLRYTEIGVYGLAWRPLGSGFETYQPISRYLVQGADSLFMVLLGLVVLYFVLPALDQLVPRTQIRDAVLSGAIGGTLIPLALDAIGIVQPGVVMGWTTLTLSLIVLFGLVMPQGVMYLFFVLPVSGTVILWGTLAIAVLGFLIFPTLGSAEALGTWAGTYGWWNTMGPGGRRRLLMRKAQSIERELLRFEVIEGGRSQTPDDDEMVH